MRIRAQALGLLAMAFGGLCAAAGTAGDAGAQSAQLRKSTASYYVGKIADYANGRLTVITNDGAILRAVIGPRTKIALLKPADLADIEEGTYIASAGLEKDSDNVEAVELRIVEQRMYGVGEGYRPYYGLAEDNATMTNAKVVAVSTTETAPVLAVRVRGRDKNIIVPDAAPIMFQLVGDQTALVPGAPVSLLTVRSRTGKTDVVRINIGLDGIQPQF